MTIIVRSEVAIIAIIVRSEVRGRYYSYYCEVAKSSMLTVYVSIHVTRDYAHKECPYSGFFHLDMIPCW